MAQGKVIDDESVAALRNRIGVELRREQPFNEVATKDAIRHFADGIGDINPLWRDEEYAKKTRYGCIIAPPTFLYSCAGGVDAAIGLPGAHSLWTKDDWEWFCPVRVNDRITDRRMLIEVSEIHGQFAAPMIAETAEAVFRNQRDEVVAKWRQTVWRFERFAPTGKRGRYSGIGKYQYTGDEIKAIEEDYSREEIRGATPRYWEEVRVGDDLPPLVKGPLTVTDIIAFKMGMGYLPYVRAHGIALSYRRRHPTAAVPNSQGVPDVLERVHWEDEFAQAIGVPAAYDYGYQRVSWLANLMTNWIGDDGFLRKVKVEIRRPNFMGDTVWFKARVSHKYIKDGEHMVECEIWGDNQRGERNTTALATAILPSRT